MKRTVLLSTVCIIMMLSAGRAVAQVVASGTTGECTWELTGHLYNYTLTISGSGAMGDYDDNNYAPWYEYRYSIRTLDIQEGVTTIGDYAFSTCSNLISVIIPDSITFIGEKSFAYCSRLTSATIPNSVRFIERLAFHYCYGLTSVTIGNSVTSIGTGAFSDCESLTTIEVDTGNPNYSSIDGVLLNILQDTLWRCPAGITESYAIPNSVTTIGEGAFEFCRILTSVTIPNSVTTIGTDAFSECRSLTSVTIPTSVTTIGEDAFFACSGLTSIDVDSNNPNYSSIDGVLFNKLRDTLIQYPSGKTGSYTIPNSVTTIGEGAFFACSGLTSIDVDAGNPNYSSIDGVLFNKLQDTLIRYPAGKMGSYTIPNSVTTIGDWAFEYCSGLTSVTIPTSVTTIGVWGFEYCIGLTSVTIPHSVTTIGNFAFWECYGLTSITIKATTPPYIDGGVFAEASKEIPLHVPCGTLAKYKQSGWRRFNNIIEDCGGATGK